MRGEGDGGDVVELCGRGWPTIAAMGEADFAAFLPGRISTEAVYVTIDKDVLRADDAATNWDQGRTSLALLKTLLAPLLAERRLIGADVVGDWSPAVYGGGVVASDLEQLGEVLSPALRVCDLAKPDLKVGAERSVLCTPGNVDEFVSAVVGLVNRPDISAALGRNARQAVLASYSWRHHVENIWRFAESLKSKTSPENAGMTSDRVETGDAYKEQVQDQWNYNPVGTHYATKTKPHTLEWFKEVEAHRYGVYAPWMPSLMEFDGHAGEHVLEIGGGIGTDLSQFASHGAQVTDLDLSDGHLDHAKENFALRQLQGRFVHDDAESLPFEDDTFDVVYSNGVLHHTPNTRRVVQEIRRVLKPGGTAIVMMYAEHSLHYWRELVGKLGLERDLLKNYSMGEIMSRHVEISQNDARPLVKVYTASRLKTLFEGFDSPEVFKRQLIASERPAWLEWMPLDVVGRLMGWNIIIKATKPRA